MRKLILSVLLFALAACAAGSSFVPKTERGAMCKAKCAQDMAICQGVPYTCDRAASTCMEACKQIDDFAAAPASSSPASPTR